MDAADPAPGLAAAHAPVQGTGYSKGLAEPAARSVQETSGQGGRVTFTWFDPPFRPEPPHCSQAYGICFTRAGMIVLGACDVDGGRYRDLRGGPAAITV